MSAKAYTYFQPPGRILLGPGPSMVDPRVNLAMASQAVGYMAPACFEVLDDIISLLQYTFQTDNQFTRGRLGHGVGRDGIRRRQLRRAGDESGGSRQRPLLRTLDRDVHPAAGRDRAPRKAMGRSSSAASSRRSSPTCRRRLRRGLSKTRSRREGTASRVATREVATGTRAGPSQPFRPALSRSGRGFDGASSEHRLRR